MTPVTDQTPAPEQAPAGLVLAKAPEPAPAPADAPAPAPLPVAPLAGPSRGSIVAYTHAGQWGPVERFGVVVGVDASDGFAYVATLPEPSPVPIRDLH